MENLRNRRQIDLVTGEEKLKKLVKKPSFRKICWWRSKRRELKALKKCDEAQTIS